MIWVDYVIFAAYLGVIVGIGFYFFMVGGLTVPTLGAFFWQRSSAPAAIAAMLTGGGLTLAFILTDTEPPFGLAASFYGLAASALVFVPISLLSPPRAP